MAILSRKIAAFAQTVVALGKRPTLKFPESNAAFDSSPEELRQALNGTIDDLSATTDGASGADQIGSGPLFTGDISTGTVMGKLKYAYGQFLTVVQGGIAAGSILLSHLSAEVTNLINSKASSSDLTTHTGNAGIHVVKDGTLQTGLSAQMVNGVYIRNNNGTLEWSADNTNWNAAGGLNGFEFGLPLF